ncbi:MAG: hypothetical protein ACXW18_09480 [Pyrinomonadaceae bacterium]
MNAAVAKKQVEAVLANRFGNVFERRATKLTEFVPTGIFEIDSSLPGFPRGGITELYGAATSGRTTMLLSTLAEATTQEETCALVDCSDTFDIASASNAGVKFDRLLWVRCSDNLEQAFKAVDLLLHGGGFGLIALNLSDVPAKSARRVISSWWFRFRRAIENTPTVLIVLTSVACVRSAAAVVFELRNEAAIWPGTLSLVFQNDNQGLAWKRNQAAKLSLVASPNVRSSLSSVPTYSRFLQGFRLGVNGERPVEWSYPSVRFNSRRH